MLPIIRPTADLICIDAIKDFLVTIEYPNEYSGNLLSDDFKNAAHLIQPDTDVFVLMFLIRAQRFGLQLAFVDPEKVKGVTHAEVINTWQYDISYFMLPGYAEVYKSDLANVRFQKCDTDAVFLLLFRFVLKHFGKADDYLKSDIHLDTIAQIVDFINAADLKPPERTYLSLLRKYRIMISTFVFFLVYWVATDVKDASISTVIMLGVYLTYRSLKVLSKELQPSS